MSKQNETQQAIADLHDMVKPGDTVYTMLRSVSKSGMSRQISLFIVSNGALVNVTAYVAVALGYTLTDKNPGQKWAVKVSGAGMDMGFHTVYNLSRTLFAGDAGDKDPGYLLRQAWL